MYKTRHISQRMSQRGITSEILNLLTSFGIQDGDKITLDKKNCLELSKIFSKLKKISEKMAEKGGYSLIASDEALITIYRLDSFNLAKAREANRQII